MTIYSDDPQSILFSNRSRIPTLEQLTQQVNSLAKILVNSRGYDDRISSLESKLVPLLVEHVFQRPTRILDTDFIISSSRKSLVFYTVELTAARVLTGIDSASVTLMVDGISQTIAENLLNVTLALGVGITNTHQKIIIGYVPPGSTVNLTSSGTGTMTLIQSLEVIL
jgi:hypothetical protein